MGYNPRLMRSLAAVFLYLLLAAGPACGFQQLAFPGATGQTLDARAGEALAVTSGHLKLDGLQSPVKVLRDHWGVAHIYAQNQHDLFFAQGFVAAQDRLFQMEMWKRSGQGRLAEVLGPSELETDHFARLLRYRGNMEAEYSSYAPDARPILEAFTAGINAFISDATRPGGHQLPVEFRLAGFLPEPWKPEDCLSRMAAFSMTGNAKDELRDAHLLAKFGPTIAARLLRLDPEIQLDPARGLDLSGLSPALLKGLVGSDRRIEFPGTPEARAGSNEAGTGNALSYVSSLQQGNGSNNWTISGKLTVSGHPLLANDPHRTIGLPSLRYMVHLVAPGWDVIGAGEPALPGVSIGHNSHIAWGLTIFPVDQQDLYVEELNPADATQYKDGGSWASMRTEDAEIAVKGGTPVHRLLKFTRQGPILWEDRGSHRALALRWVGSEPGTAGYLASLTLDRAGNWSEFLSAMKRWKLPPENMVYADTEGNIGEQSAGLVPLRRGWSGLLPVPASGAYEWSGFIPLQELPRVFNPREGFYATANHKIIPPNYPYKVGYEWSKWRIERINQVLAGYRRSNHKIDSADMTALQNDVLSLPALELVKMLSRRPARRGRASAARRMLLEWDGTLDANSTAAALYEIWLATLRDAVFAEIIRGSGRSAAEPELADILTVDAIIQFISDNGHYLLLEKTLEEAMRDLSKIQGPEMAAWRWGALHEAEFRHDLDRQPGGHALFDRGRVARPGDGDTVNATGFDSPPRRASKPDLHPGLRTGEVEVHTTDEASSDWRQTSGASFREIVDTGDWDRSLAINVPGQSGQPGSPHYDDLLPIWAEGKYFSLLYSREKVLPSAEQELILDPGNAE